MEEITITFADAEASAEIFALYGQATGWDENGAVSLYDHNVSRVLSHLADMARSTRINNEVQRVRTEQRDITEELSNAAAESATADFDMTWELAAPQIKQPIVDPIVDPVL